MMQTYRFIFLAVLFCLLPDSFLCYQWDYFTFSQQWPPGTCAEASEKHHHCMIPEEVKTWTVHGLWPSIFDSRVPENCNSSWHFDIDKIATIRADLAAYWPNLFTDTPVGSFWEHEWSKHGTCSTDLPATADELKYFTMGITLNRQYDISRILADAGIIPSLQATYKFEDFMNAVTEGVGFPPVLQCQVATMKNGSKLHMISQIEICLDKQFKPRTCYSKMEKGDKPDDNVNSNRVIVQTMQNEDDTLYFKRHSKKSHSHAGPQSDCPRKYEFYYPPMHYQ